jgi:hypothetical protein
MINQGDDAAAAAAAAKTGPKVARLPKKKK